MKITKALMDWLIANRDVEKEASEDDFRMEAGKAIAEGELSPEKYAELTKEKKVEEANEFSKKLDDMTTGIKDLTKALLSKEDDGEKDEKKTDTQTKEKEGLKDVTKIVGENGGTPVEPEKKSLVDVKSMKDVFSTTKSAMTYPITTKGGQPHSLAGRPVLSCGRALDSPSDLDKAMAGAWAKFELASAIPQVAGSASRAWEMMNETDKSLLHHLCEEGMWDATTKENHPRMAKGYRGGTKQLIDDVASGGLEAAPIVFDDMVIEAPLLYSELYPHVNEVVLPRGRRIEAVSIGTVTGGWGGIDATNIPLFATAGYVAAFDTTVFRWEGAIQIGLDFLSDTPIDFGGTITRQYGERLLEDLDDVIATGNGVNQPQGIMNAAGTTVVAFGGATTLGAYETLLFGVHKREHKPNVMSSACFCGTETSYMRARALNVTAADQRRLGGGEGGQGDYRSYKWMGRPYKINESLANTQLFYAILARYRMYRRRGFTVRSSTEGQTLIRLNEMLISVTARYGGQLERGACAAVSTTAPA